jgi:hypothetical protein
MDDDDDDTQVYKDHGDALTIAYQSGYYDGKKAAQRPWVGLTDEEAQWLYDNCRTPSNLIEMVEARLKDKNT